jgi:hypothetical protein
MEQEKVGKAVGDSDSARSVESFGRFSTPGRFDDARPIRGYGRLFGANLRLRLGPVRHTPTLWPSVLLPQRISPFSNGLFSRFRHAELPQPSLRQTTFCWPILPVLANRFCYAATLKGISRRGSLCRS